jgi:hypothetical protein
MRAVGATEDEVASVRRRRTPLATKAGRSARSSGGFPAYVVDQVVHLKARQPRL